jgi:phosphoribosylaminoimidazole-succinocarboxamide synthase
MLVHQTAIAELDLPVRRRGLQTQSLVGLRQFLVGPTAAHALAKTALRPQHRLELGELYPADPETTGNTPQELAFARLDGPFTQRQIHLDFQKRSHEVGLMPAGATQHAHLLVNVETRLLAAREQRDGLADGLRPQAHAVHHRPGYLDLLFRHAPVGFRYVPHNQEGGLEEHLLTVQAAKIAAVLAQPLAREAAVELVPQQGADDGADVTAGQETEQAPAHFAQPAVQGSSRPSRGRRSGAKMAVFFTGPIGGKNMTEALYESRVSGLSRISQGKVRDIYAVDEDHLLIVTTDRLSAFDVVLPDPIPGKGEVLTRLSEFWFARTAHIVPNHLAALRLEDIVPNPTERAMLGGRAMICRHLQPLPIEAVVRGYLIGSGWKDYRATGQVCGIALPAGLAQAQQLPQPIFTPATKAAIGDHDENISFEQAAELVGRALAERVRDLAIRIYQEGAAYAAERGIIIADTKFEFGLDAAGKLYLIDEVLTPDSSRFWPASDYATGISPPSFDKQYVRDYLETLDWNKKAPGPRLPAEVIRRTSEKYRQALELLTAYAGPQSPRS